MIIVLAASASTAAAAGEETHVFEATRSLTGNCEVSSVDPVRDPSCPAEPTVNFVEPYGVTTDSYGDIFYFGRSNSGGPIRLYIFSSSGHFLVELPHYAETESIASAAVDPEGNLYVDAAASNVARHHLYLFRPTVYHPEAGEIAYGAAPTAIAPTLEIESASQGLALDRLTDRLFVVPAGGSGIAEIGSYAEGNTVLRTFGTGLSGTRNANLAVDAITERIYVSDKLGSGAFPSGVKEFDFAGNLLKTITGVETTEGFHEFKASFGLVGVAVDESTGHLFFSDLPSQNPNPSVYEVTATGEPVMTIRHSFQGTNNNDQIAIDNGVHSPNSSMNPHSPIVEEGNLNGSYLFVPTGAPIGHLFAFEPKPIPKPPVVEEENFTGVGTGEVVLHAKVNPKGLVTNYRFEYVTAAAFEKDVEELGVGHGFDHASTGAIGTLPGATEAIAFSAPLLGLEPGTAYLFRVVASNLCEGEARPACETNGETVSFSTYAEQAVSQAPCPNQAYRTGLSTTLPDCRAYELVTPANTNGHSPLAPNSNGAGPHFGTPTATAQGDALAFLTTGGAIPGYPGAGGFNGDPYVASRTTAGWATTAVGPSGLQSTNPLPGGLSPDLRYLAWSIGAEDEGELALQEGTTYVRDPEGDESLVGKGSLATDLFANPEFISAGETHLVFRTQNFGPDHAPKLEPQAPPSGTGAIYDRTADGVVHVVSLLPGDVTPAPGQNATYEGISADGSAVAFKIGTTSTSPLYVRLDDSTTVEVAGAGATFEGLSADGRHAFYLSAGDLYRYDTGTEESLRITTVGHVTVVNIPSGGEGAYFASTAVIAGQNPNGAEPVAGEANLYYWDSTDTHFVATVTKRDMEGEFTGILTRDGLALWTKGLEIGSTAQDPSRTTPGGGTIVFESNADLTGYESGGASEIYRYDAGAASLRCLSCDPTQAPATGDARLQTILGNAEVPTNAYSIVPSLSGSGERVFFETPDRLVPADTDGIQDVYEWESDGEGTCSAAGGCVFLISSGRSAHPNYLYGVSESGEDVFIWTTDLLNSGDGDETPSVYDARVEGGFAEATGHAAECLGEACQPAATPPAEQTTASLAFEGPGNVPREAGKKPNCPKGKKAVKQGGKWKCVAKKGKQQKKSKKKAHKRADTKGRAVR